VTAVSEGESAASLLGGRYRLEKPIGYGGMSTVYRARDESLGRKVAVKLFNANVAEPGRQEGELAVLSSLEHHSLVNLFDAGVDSYPDGRPARYLVMALINGPTLSERIQKGPIAARHIAEVGYDMAEALQYIHGHNVIHRDIKPSNILLVDYGNAAQRARAKLTDFGIALADDVERMTAEGATTGTAAYLSPEQVAGSEVGAPSDIYALGLVLLECFTRMVEFPGSIVESAIARLTRDPVIPENLPDYWRSLLTSMTSRVPAERPNDADLVAMLRQVVIADSARHRDEEPTFIPGAPGQALTPSPLLETLPNLAIDRATALSARIMSAPISIVSIISNGRLVFKGYFGEEVAAIAREIDLSSIAGPTDEPVLIEDGRTDPRAMNSPLVTGALALRFYVGVPIKVGGVTLGTLSVLNSVPGTATATDMANLEDIAALVGAQLEARTELARITSEMIETVPIETIEK
jgi:serine/threonine protein kinase